MCLYPRLLKNPKYQKNKKNGGVIPAIRDTRVLFVPIGCGNCIECRKQKQREWQVRLLEDIKTHTNGKFITLTFSNESIKELTKEVNKVKLKRIRKTITLKNGKKRNYYRYDEHTQTTELKGYDLDNAIATLAMRRFLERWRKEYKVSLRHWTVTELGHNGTENIHLHGIIWTNDISKLEKIWQYGYVWKGYMKNGKLENYVNGRTVNYIIKYVSKMDLDHKHYKSKTLCSAGIGGDYTKNYNSKLNKFNYSETKETYKTSTGHEIAMPTYWRNKIYDDEEKEILWLIRLDKCERWICGEKVSVKYNDDEYWRLLKYHRKRNWQLGYRGYKLTEEDYHRKMYEQERREMLHGKRTAMAKI